MDKLDFIKIGMFNSSKYTVENKNENTSNKIKHICINKYIHIRIHTDKYKQNMKEKRSVPLLFSSTQNKFCPYQEYIGLKTCLFSLIGLIISRIRELFFISSS